MNDRPVDDRYGLGERGFMVLSTMMIVLFVIVFIRTAWVCDDAYITFRTVDNFLNGYGLTWNTAERVQAYTNPLWMFMVSFVCWFTGEVYFSCIFLSLVISVLALILVMKGTAASPWTACLAVLLLIFSKAFIDYSSSGLENPLTHFLAGLFLVIYFRRPEGKSAIWLYSLSLIAAVATLNRMDTVLLFLPALGYGVWQTRSRKNLFALAMGFLPFILWELFALFYYGFLFPNSAYAKLNVGIARSDFIKQGLIYFLNSLAVDPLTLLAIVTAVAAALFGKRRQHLPLAMGIFLYLGYVIVIGGDFMSGRFLTAPLFIAVAILSRLQWPEDGLGWLMPISLILLVGFSSPSPPLLSGKDYDGAACTEWEEKRIADARGFFYPTTGLLKAKLNSTMPNHNWVKKGWRARRQVVAGEEWVFLRGSVGFQGYFAGPQAHIVDKLSLSDPLLSKLPAKRRTELCIGHFQRTIPQGYLDSIRSGENVIEDQKLAQYYEKLSLITRGRLFSTQRLIEIWKMNIGHYDHLIDHERYKNPTSLYLNLSELEIPKTEEIVWNAKGNVVTAGAVEISIGAIIKERMLEATLRGNFTYEIQYYLEETIIAQRIISTPPHLVDSLAKVHISTPETAVEHGFDMIRIVPVKGVKQFSLGYLRVAATEDQSRLRNSRSTYQNISATEANSSSAAPT